MKLTHHRPWALVLPFLLACGSVESSTASGSSGAGGSNAAALPAACEHLFANLAAYDKACGAAPAEFPDHKISVETCIGLVTAPGSLVKPSDFDACASRLGATPCDDGASYYACFGYGGDLIFPNHDVKGTRHVGESCVASLQCESGYCDGLGGCGKCLAVARVGEACPAPQIDLCVDSECREGICQLEGLREGESCANMKGVNCQQTLYCNKYGASNDTAACVPLRTAGDACVSSGQCEQDLFCKASTCTPRLPLGAPCQSDGYGYTGCKDTCVKGVCSVWKLGLAENEDCSVGYCRRDLSCSNGVCKDLHYLPQGAPCQAGEGVPACVAGLFCKAPCPPGGPCPSVGVCAALPKAGEACVNYSICAPEAVCEGVKPSENPSEDQPGVCVKLGLEGEACPCAQAFTCAKEKCAPYSPALCE
jgi:hypothetical protein